MQENLQLPRWVYLILAVMTGAIGLAASAITAKFFILGLERLEPDPMARSILVATGLLMIATELAAFGIAALLPANKLRSIRRKLIATGLLLLAFEVATICVTQGALDQASESAAMASTQRVQELQTTIEARRAAAQSLRALGTSQSASSNGWTRTLGAAALRDALKVESQIDPLGKELAQLQAAARPITASVIGTQGVMVYGVAKGLLISAMGLVMFSAAGALLREAMAVSQVVPESKPALAAAQQVKTVSHGVRVSAAAAQESTAIATGLATSMVGRGLGRGKDWCCNLLGIPKRLTAGMMAFQSKPGGHAISGL